MKTIYNLFLILGVALLTSCWSMEDVQNIINQAPEVTVKKIDTTFMVKDDADVQYIYTYGREDKEDREPVYYAMRVSDVNKNLKNVVFLDRNDQPLSGTVYDQTGQLITNFDKMYEFTQAEQRAEGLQRFFKVDVPCALIAADQKTELPVKVITTDLEGRKTEKVFYYKNYKRLDGDIKISITNDTITVTNRYTHFLSYSDLGLGQLTYKSRSTENIADFGRTDINFQTFRGAISGKHWDDVDKNTGNKMDLYFSKGGSLPNIWVGQNSIEYYYPIKKRNYPYFFNDPDFRDFPIYLDNDLKKIIDDMIQTREGQTMPYLETENFLAPLEPFDNSPKDNSIPANWEDIIVGQQALPLKYRISVDFGKIEQRLLKKYGLENKIRLEFNHELEDAGLPEGQQTLSKRVGIESVVDNNAPPLNTYMRERVSVSQTKNGVQYEGLQYIHLLSDEMMINCIGELTERYFISAKNYSNSLGTDGLFFKMYDQAPIIGDNGVLPDIYGPTTSLANRLNSNLGVIDRFFTLDGVQREENDLAPYFGNLSQAPTAITSLRVPERYQGKGMDYVRYAHRSFGVEFSDTVLVNQYDPATGIYFYTSQVIRPHINKNLFTFGAGNGYEGRWSGTNSYNTQFKGKNLSKFETILYNAVTFTDPNGQDEYLRFRQQWMDKITEEDAEATKYYPYVTKIWYTVDANQNTNIHVKTINYKESKVERGTLDFFIK